MTRLFGVIGDPVTHSLSPLIHRGWMRDLDIDADYVGFHVPGDALACAFETFDRRNVRGLNVTLPHKQDVAPMCASRSRLVERIGAANTLTRQPDGSWHADNTDHDGFLEDFRAQFGAPLQGARIRVIGAGGAARAVVLALSNTGARVSLANRTPERAGAMARDLGLGDLSPVPFSAGLAQLDAVDAVVNTASLGDGGEHLDVAPGHGRVFYDISYGARAETVLSSAHAAGWRTLDGLGMLVSQAALSFEIWFSHSPDRTRALERCRAALEASR